MNARLLCEYCADRSRQLTWVMTTAKPALTNWATRRCTSGSGSIPLSGFPTDSSKQPSTAPPLAATAAAKSCLHHSLFQASRSIYANIATCSRIIDCSTLDLVA